MARPQLEINEDTVEKLAAINCSMKEIGDVVGCSVDTLGRRFAEAIEKGRSQGKMSLKRKMWDTAMSGNVVMMIWLSKQMLGYREPPKDEIPVDDNKEKPRLIIDLTGSTLESTDAKKEDSHPSSGDAPREP